jgi:hypothetical protein
MVGIHSMTATRRNTIAGMLFILAASRVEAVPNMDPLFEKAVVSSGAEYLQAEEALRHRGPGAEAVLRDNLQNPDPVARLIADVVLGWSGARASEYEDVLAFLDAIPGRLSRTPISVPSPTGVAGTLTQNYGDRVAGLLMLRLLKRPDWPRWRALAVLFYLEEQKLPALTAALIRFVVEIDNPEWSEAALQVLRATDDPGLRAKIAAERERARLLEKPFPTALVDLEKRP